MSDLRRDARQISGAGIGFKGQHAAELLRARPGVGFLEVHAENYFGDGGPPHRALSQVAEHYPLSVHGVGLSLGGAEPLDEAHLAALKRVVDRYQPTLVSEHIAWCGYGGRFLNDLLPLPYDGESVATLAAHVSQTQDFLGQQIMIENPSTYLLPAGSDRSEPEFLADVCRRAGCHLLLDVNNVYVSAQNHGWDAEAYLAAVPDDLVSEVHLAGHLVDEKGGHRILVDDHGAHVADPVWALYEAAIIRFGPVPTLIEWDTRVPELATLVAEAERADRVARRALAASSPERAVEPAYG